MHQEGRAGSADLGGGGLHTEVALLDFDITQSAVHRDTHQRYLVGAHLGDLEWVGAGAQFGSCAADIPAGRSAQGRITGQRDNAQGVELLGSGIDDGAIAADATAGNDDRFGTEVLAVDIKGGAAVNGGIVVRGSQ